MEESQRLVILRSLHRECGHIGRCRQGFPDEGWEVTVKIVRGWRRIDNQRGYINEVTGQNLVVTKKPYGEHYIVLLFSKVRNSDEGKTISPAFPTQSKAESFAVDWMNKHPRGPE
jgi:hypothetical protein